MTRKASRLRRPTFLASPRLSGLLLTPTRQGKPCGEPFVVNWLDVEVSETSGTRSVAFLHGPSGHVIRRRILLPEAAASLARKCQARDILRKWRAGSLQCTIDRRSQIREAVTSRALAGLFFPAAIALLGWGAARSPTPIAFPPVTRLEWVVVVLFALTLIGLLVFSLVSLRSAYLLRQSSIPHRLTLEGRTLLAEFKDGRRVSLILNASLQVRIGRHGSILTTPQGDHIPACTFSARERAFMRVAADQSPAGVFPPTTGSASLWPLLRPALIFVLGHALAAAVVWWLDASGSLGPVQWRSIAWTVLAMPLFLLPIGALHMGAARLTRQPRRKRRTSLPTRTRAEAPSGARIPRA